MEVSIYEQVLSFEVVMSDEEIVYGPIGDSYPFNYSRKALIMNSVNNRRAKEYMKKGGNPPRPLNSFMIYRKNKSVEVQERIPGSKSKKISEMWNAEPKQIKELFEAMSRMAKQEHIKRYGSDYKYKPKKSQRKGTKARRTKAKQNEATSSEPSTDQPISTPLLSIDDDSQYIVDESNTESNSSFSSPSLSNSSEYDNDEHMVDAAAEPDIHPNNSSNDFLLYDDHDDHDDHDDFENNTSNTSLQGFGYVPEDHATSPPPITGLQQSDFSALVELVNNLSCPEYILLISFLTKRTDPLPQLVDLFYLANHIGDLPHPEYDLIINILSKKMTSTDPPPFDLTSALASYIHHLPYHEYLSLMCDLLYNSGNTQSPDNNLFSETDLSLHAPYISSHTHNFNFFDSLKDSRSLQ